MTSPIFLLHSPILLVEKLAMRVRHTRSWSKLAMKDFLSQRWEKVTSIYTWDDMAMRYRTSKPGLPPTSKKRTRASWLKSTWHLLRHNLDSINDRRHLPL